MFTGIIKEVGTVTKIDREKESMRFTIQADLAEDTHIDESISVNGVCLTVMDRSTDSFSVQCVDETTRKTTLSSLSKGDPVNLERALRLKDGIEGHLVQGHVDGTGVITDIQTASDRLIEIEYPESFRDLVVPQGSITVDGISLTLAGIDDDRFTVAIIPHTYRNTNLQYRKQGEQVNLEFDMIGKYVARFLENRSQ